MFSLKDRVACVTGATGGIGESIAHALAKQGATVVLSGTRVSVLKELAERLENETGQKPLTIPCSLKDPESVESLVPMIEEKLGCLDILVNNAGITRDALALRLSNEAWDEVIAINLTASFRLCRSALKFMMKRRFGRIINISSVVGITGNAGQTNYCASKAGMIGFSKALAQEVATRGITVNCIAPGFIETPMTASLPDGVQSHILQSIPLGRMGTPQEIASSVVFLASEEASYITGHTLHVNGGMAMV